MGCKLNPTPPSVTNGERCREQGTVGPCASGVTKGEDYKWYDALTGGNLLQTNGASYNPLISTTNYYVTKYNKQLFVKVLL